MFCDPLTLKITGFLHVIALVVSFYGTYEQVQSVQQGKPDSPILAIALTFMLLLRIPNQICVALREPHGWFSVIGTLAGALGFGYLAYVTQKYSKSKDPQAQAHTQSQAQSPPIADPRIGRALVRIEYA